MILRMEIPEGSGITEVHYNGAVYPASSLGRVLTPGDARSSLESLDFTKATYESVLPDTIEGSVNIDIVGSSPFIWTNSYGQTVYLMCTNITDPINIAYELIKPEGLSDPLSIIASGTTYAGASVVPVPPGDSVRIVWATPFIPTINIYPSEKR